MNTFANLNIYVCVFLYVYVIYVFVLRVSTKMKNFKRSSHICALYVFKKVRIIRICEKCFETLICV